MKSLFLEDLKKFDDLFSRPAVVQIDLTNSCNLRCFYCYEVGNKTKGRELRDKEVMYIITKVVEELDPVFISFSGGEPFMRKKLLFKLLEYLLKKDVDVIVNTNGTLLSKEDIRKLKELEVFKININLEAMNPEIHDKIRGVRGSFSRVMKTLRMISEEGLSERTSIATVINKLNLNEIPKIARFVKEKDFMEYHLLDMIPVTKESKKYMLEKEDWIYFVKKVYPKILRENINIRPNHALLFLLNFKNVRIPFCMAGRLKMVITANGYVVPCNYFKERDYIVGNALKDNLLDIWRNSKILRCFRYYIPSSCLNCSHKMKCAGGCRALSKVLLGDPSLPDPYCSRYSLQSEAQPGE